MKCHSLNLKALKNSGQKSEDAFAFLYSQFSPSVISDGECTRDFFLLSAPSVAFTWANLSDLSRTESKAHRRKRAETIKDPT